MKKGDEFVLTLIPSNQKFTLHSQVYTRLFLFVRANLCPRVRLFTTP